MNRDLPALANQQFDLLIIGGGIFGAGVARDAALRGLRVALIDKADFASGTSSRSTKLIHGGFRYLEQREFCLVAEACRERAILQRIAPHLVRPRPFLLPVYDGDPRSLGLMRLGMTLYDLLALGRNTSRHRTLSAEQALLKEPTLARNGLRGALLFYDCQEDDARFCIDNIIQAAEYGAVCANYCEVQAFVARERRLVSACAMDRFSADVLEISARVFVNAAGVAVERVAALTPFEDGRLALSPTKGIHLLLPKLTQQHGVFFQQRADRRMLFAIPWGDCSLVGTTDTDFGDDPDDVVAEPDEIAYLLNAVRPIFPAVSIGESDIITTFAGVRALLRSDEANPSARSREHRITRQGDNFITITGGKYTTYRAIAEEVVDEVCEILGERSRRCRTAQTPIREHRPPPTGDPIADSPLVCVSDIVHACEYEMAMTVSDVMRRRTSLALSRNGNPAVAARVARVMARFYGWSEAQQHAHLKHYADEWKRNLP
jgi:glycerol-3-phosphate dehydrogenase